MHIAVDINSEEIINLLLSKGANVNAKGIDGITSLHLAAQRGYLRIVEQLLKHRAYINASDNFDRTSLHFVVEFDHIGV